MSRVPLRVLFLLPFVVGLSWMLLAERLTPLDGVGGALVLLGVYVSSRHPTSEGRTRRQLLAGSLLATASMATMAVSVVVAKPVLETTGIWQASLVRLAAGWLAMALLTPVLPGGLGTWRVFRPARTWRFSLPAAVLGTYVAMMLWLVGFKYTDASIAAILNQTSTIFGLVLAALFLREPLTGRKVAAIVLAFAGVVLITSF